MEAVTVDVIFKRCIVNCKTPITCLIRPIGSEVDVSLNLTMCIEIQRMQVQSLSRRSMHGSGLV